VYTSVLADHALMMTLEVSITKEEGMVLSHAADRATTKTTLYITAIIKLFPGDQDGKQLEMTSYERRLILARIIRTI
jgi:hypothetical protein